jgi:hypothetical protein
MNMQGMDGKDAHPEGHLDGNALCDYAEGALDAHAHAAAEAHLRDCPDCLRELKAVRAYFRELSDLEPVKAPPNFLANVRARLPQPSPWASVFGTLMRPWRAVPVSIAGLTILGVAIISLYVQQRGGITETSVALAPASAQAPEAQAPAQHEAERQAPAPSASEPPAPREEKRKADRFERMAKDDAPAKPSAAPPMPPAGPSPKAAAGASGTSRQAALEYSSSPALADREGWDRKGAEYADEAGNRDEMAAAKEERMDRPAAAPAEKILGNASPDSRETADAAGSGVTSLAKAAPMKKAKSLAPAARPPVPARQSAPAHPAFAVKPRNIQDTTAILSGLRAMGAEILPWNGGTEPGHLLRVPPSMIPELRPYLDRYGSTTQEGSAGPASGGQETVSLRFILP